MADVLDIKTKSIDLTANVKDLGLIAEVWGIDESSINGVARANYMHRLKHGLMAQVPIVCRNSNCPYVSTCYIDPKERPKNGRCPIEISMILTLFDKYCGFLDVGEDDIVDLSLVRELVDLDVQLMRADHYMAANPDFVEDVVYFVNEDGMPITKPEIARVVEYKERLRRERHRILQLLNSTRKDRESSQVKRDPSSLAAEVISKARELGLYKTIEVKTQESEG